MNDSITIEKKRVFLKWFLENYQLKRRECGWLLNFLLSDDMLIEKVHFVDDLTGCPRAMKISTNEMEDVAFSFHKKHYVTMDAEKTFHDIRLNRQEDIYVQLNFNQKYTCSRFISVLEGNPFNKEAVIDRRISLMAELIIKESMHRYEMMQLDKQIDQCLAEGNKNEFKELASKYRKLKALER